VPNDRPRRTPQSLGGYIEAIVTTLASNDAFAAARMRRVAAGQRARIMLDDEAVEVTFHGEQLRIEPAGSGRRVDGTGQTDRRTVLDLLAGRLETSAAILDGLIKIEGTPDAVAAILLIIEMVLDASSRNPALQILAREFVDDRSSRRVYAPGAESRQLATAWYPFAHAPVEDRILARLDLLPDRDG
jgi:hypothetical protein